MRHSTDEGSAPGSARSATNGRRQTDRVIVVGVDGSRHGLEALQWALEESRVRNARVRAVCAWTAPTTSTIFGSTTQQRVDQLSSTAAATLSSQIEQAIGEAGDVTYVERCVVNAPAQEALLRASADADLLVVGSRGHRPFAGAVLGSVAQHCLHHAACPVAVVHAAHHGDRRRIVAGVDGSAGADAALEWAADEARLRGTSVLAVCAHHEPSAAVAGGIATAGAYARLREGLEWSAEQLLERAERSVEGVPISTKAVHGPVAEALLSAAGDAEVLVVGSRGRGGFASLILGSVSLRCATRARGVVVVVPNAYERRRTTASTREPDLDRTLGREVTALRNEGV